MAAPEIIKDLVDRFARNEEQYRSSDYNEARLRQEFLNPMFKALGWDMENEQGWAEPYKEVIHEDSIIVGSGKKAPDYSFRIGEKPKFFVEAKKPRASIDSSESAFQLRRYGWSAKLSLSILTNFREFAVYDCRYRPEEKDKPGLHRIEHFTYEKLIDKWDYLVSIFSKVSIQKGSFDKYALEGKGRRGTQPVDDEFLKEIEGWREILARNISLRNKTLSLEDLNFSVGKIIDRLLFLRICEDREIEEYEQIGKLRDGIGTYAKMIELFRKADDWYNAGLFHFNPKDRRAENPDLLTPKLIVDDKFLKDIIKTLYNGNPYEFSVFPADILGQVYEQFLGKVIVKEGRTVKPVEKPEVKKAGGVYYTPTYIVDYIVKHTVGKLVEDKTPEEISKLRVLDPACGSGSFLIGAYQSLLDWHLAYYENLIKQKKVSPAKLPVHQSQSGKLRLTLSERKRILINNIYGVDIDAQAVEVSKLSLLLKVLEGESRSTVAGEHKIAHHALPDLGNNIKCGNSLVAPDISDMFPDLTDAELHKINPFDWKEEFTPVFKQGGFDAVIGNPPYVRQEVLGDQFKEYAESVYQVYDGVADLYTYFIERGISFLRPNGLFGYIVANKWLRTDYGIALKRWLKTKALLELIDFGDLPVFEDANAYPCILIVEAGSAKKNFLATEVDTLAFSSLDSYTIKKAYKQPIKTLSDEAWILGSVDEHNLLSRLRTSFNSLYEYINENVYRGVVTGSNEAFVIDEKTRKKIVKENAKSKEIIKPFLVGKDIKRYSTLSPDSYVIFTRRGIDIKRYPAVHRHLRKFKDVLLPKPESWKGGEWQGRKSGDYEWFEIQDTIAYYKEFSKPKIIYPNICRRPEFTFDKSGLFTNQKCFIIPTNDLFLLGVLNSAVMSFLFKKRLPRLRGGFYEPSLIYFRHFPVPTLDRSKPADKARHDKMVKLVEKMLELNKKLPEIKSPVEQEKVKRQIASTDKQIDDLVYDLYGLSAEEIRIVEGK